MGRIDDLADKYEAHIRTPWQRTLAGAQRVIMVCYDKDRERSLRARVGEFEHRTRDAGHGWHLVDCTRLFAEWMAADEYREAYFESPDDLRLKLEAEFRDHVADAIRPVLQQAGERDIVAVMGVASVYGFARLSDVLRRIEGDIRGRLVVFFPGQKDENNYRLLDARDGWSYLAIGITADAPGVTA